MADKARKGSFKGIEEEGVGAKRGTAEEEQQAWIRHNKLCIKVLNRSL